MSTMVTVVFCVVLGAVFGVAVSLFIEQQIRFLWCIVAGISGAFAGAATAYIFGLADSIFVSVLLEVIATCLFLFFAYLLVRK